MERFSAGYQELLRMFSLNNPFFTEDINKIRFEIDGLYKVEDLCGFLNHDLTIEQLRARKLQSKDDNLKQTSD
jgi:hypothetical protein